MRRVQHWKPLVSGDAGKLSAMPPTASGMVHAKTMSLKLHPDYRCGCPDAMPFHR